MKTDRIARTTQGGMRFLCFCLIVTAIIGLNSDLALASGNDNGVVARGVAFEVAPEDALYSSEELAIDVALAELKKHKAGLLASVILTPMPSSWYITSPPPVILWDPIVIIYSRPVYERWPDSINYYFRGWEVRLEQTGTIFYQNNEGSRIPGEISPQ